MLIRLQIDGFKNLVGMDVRFGPFTCIAGVNGVGKSNLFDAICFLSALANQPLLEAALSIRNEKGRGSDVRNIFHHYGNTYEKEMSFIADMIIPIEAIDDLGQKATATYTFIRYSLNLGLRENTKSINPLEIIKEEMTYLPKQDFKKNVLFNHSAEWRKSILIGQKRYPFISTETSDSGQRFIKLHQDGKQGGKPQALPASTLPRTVLSNANAAESPTVLCTRREIESWKLLQLEPSALRKPDDFTATPFLSFNGEHLAATVNRLGEQQYQRIANSLSTLIDDIKEVRVEKNEKRETYTVFVATKDGTEHPAQSLSDGTLRFLALSVLRMDPETKGVLCLEEPENGIHPERIPAMLKLLTDIAVDCDEPVDESNPLRQVIVNTHSPAVIAQIPDDSLLMAENEMQLKQKFATSIMTFSGMSDTWRAKQPGFKITTKGHLISYLNPFKPENDDNTYSESYTDKIKNRVLKRVIDRPDYYQLSIFPLLSEKKPRYE
ncbi:MAG: ATPase [Desulfobacteraceae bacterium]|nr:MAG: ATPase [Desulfobacteraceae bacterium]